MSGANGWNPFGDPEGSPYLRNVEALTDPRLIAMTEFGMIGRNMPAALTMLEAEPCLGLLSWQQTHRILFGELYPWAGTLRHVSAARGSISEFSPWRMIERHAEAAFQLADTSSTEAFIDVMGEVYGGMARCHPFLEGNGRSMNAVFSELCARAGIGIAWDAIRRDEWLEALTSAVAFGKDVALLGLFARHLVEPEGIAARAARLGVHRSGPISQ